VGTNDWIGAWREGQARARWTTYLLYACLVLDVIGILSGLLQRALLSRVAAGEHLSPGEAEANDSRHATVGLLQVAAVVLTGIVWLAWLHRAYSNLQRLGTGKSKFTPGWAVGYWFIPFVNLVRPYQIVKDLWLRSESRNDRASLEGVATPALISWWWGMYLLAGFGGRLLASEARTARTIGELLSVTDIGMAVDGIAIVADALAIAVVRGVDRYQRRYELGTAAAGEADPPLSPI
jgi:hypothetical protein